MADPARDAVKAGVARCDAITDNRAWLDCFYGAAQPMRATLGLSPAPQVAKMPQGPAPQPVIASAPPPRTAPPPKPGMLDGVFGTGIKLVVGLHLREVSYRSDGTFVITLEDGQVWKQNNPPTPRANFDGPPSGIMVDITSGLLGSDSLRIRGSKTVYKVHRLE